MKYTRSSRSRGKRKQKKILLNFRIESVDDARGGIIQLTRSITIINFQRFFFPSCNICCFLSFFFFFVTFLVLRSTQRSRRFTRFDCIFTKNFISYDFFRETQHRSVNDFGTRVQCAVRLPVRSGERGKDGGVNTNVENRMEETLCNGTEMRRHLRNRSHVCEAGEEEDYIMFLVVHNVFPRLEFSSVENFKTPFVVSRFRVCRRIDLKVFIRFKKCRERRQSSPYLCPLYYFFFFFVRETRTHENNNN